MPATLVGTLEAGPSGARGRSRRRWLVPFDPRLALELPVSGAGEVPEGQFAVVAVERSAGGEPRIERRPPAPAALVHFDRADHKTAGHGARHRARQGI